MRRLSVLFLLASCISGFTFAQQAADTTADDFIRTHYVKQELHIPMRDGVKLFAAVYVPRAEALEDKGPYPFLITRTPYSCGPYGEDKYPRRFAGGQEMMHSGYIFVCEDVRGRYQSGGTFVEMSPHIDEKKSAKDVDDASDMYDTVDYLLKHIAHHNGRVGITGISYPGFYTSASIIDSHPAIKAASPQAPMTNLFAGADDSYHGGAFMLSANFSFYTGFLQQKTPILPDQEHSVFEFNTPDTYDFYLHAGNLAELNRLLTQHGQYSLFTDQMLHTTYDSYWQKRNLAPHMKHVHAAVMTVGGWFDAEDLTGPFQTFHAIDQFNPDATNTLVVGPWVHGGWAGGAGDHLGDISFGAKTGEFFRSQIQFPFFEHYLKEKPMKALPKAYVFETGSNVWRSYEAWPPKQTEKKMLYLQSNGGLSWSAPTEVKAQDEYVSDPAHPVPFVGYVTDSVPQRYMDDDQRFAAERPDVLVYQTEPLQQDMTLAGPITPRLYIASTGTDSDFVVKLIDVYPTDFPAPQENASGGKRILSAPPLVMGGYQQLVRGEPFRAKLRNSLEVPEPLVPGQVTALSFPMPDINHTFQKGHRIMIQIQSSWFPLTDRNPQTFTDIPTAKPEQFVKATETVFRTMRAPSGVEVWVLPRP